MPLDFTTIDALTNGVSQQAPNLRLDSQADEQINYVSSVIEGLVDRPASRLVRRLAASLPSGPTYLHAIDRSTSEQYFVVLDGAGGLDIYDLDGNAQVVNGLTASVQTYLTTVGDPRQKFRAATVSDLTFITNREIEVAMDAAESDPEDNIALFWVRQTDTGKRFHVHMSHTYSGDWLMYDIPTTQGDLGGGDGPPGQQYAIGAISTTVDDDMPTPVCSMHTEAFGRASSSAMAGLSVTSAAQKLAKAIDLTIDAQAAASYAANGQSMETWELIESPVLGTSWVSLPFSNGSQAVQSSVIALRSTTASDETVRFSGSSQLSDSAFSVIHRVANSLSDLPGTGAPIGFRVRVSEETADKLDDWYVRYDGSHWKEVVGFEVPLGFDNTTMPHQLTRDSSTGEWTIEVAEWAERTAGDTESAPDPTFVGKSIKDITVFKNRLCFIVDTNVVFSEAGEFLNFWPTTVRQLLDSDPIDLAIDAGSSAPKFDSATAFDQVLLVNGPNAQGIVQGTDVFTLETVSADVVTDYPVDTTLQPLSTGRTLLFKKPRSTSGAILEYAPDPQTGAYIGIDITGHVPRYLPSIISWQSITRSEDIAVFGSDTDPHTMWVYKYLYDGTEKVQASWSTWTVSDYYTIRGGFWFQDSFYILCDTTEGDSVLLVMELYEDPYLGFDFAPRLDGREVLTGGIFIPALGGTAFIPSADLDDSMTDYRSFRVNTGGDDEGQEVSNLISSGGTSVVVPGDLSGEDLMVGTTISRRYRPTEYRLRSPSRDSRGTPEPVTTGRVQLRRVKAELADAGYLKAEVASPGSSRTKTYVPVHVGNSVGPTPQAEYAEFEVPIGRNARGTDIDFTNESIRPTSITALHYEALYHNRSRRRSR